MIKNRKASRNKIDQENEFTTQLKLKHSSYSKVNNIIEEKEKQLNLSIVVIKNIYIRRDCGTGHNYEVLSLQLLHNFKAKSGLDDS